MFNFCRTMAVLGTVVYTIIPVKSDWAWLGEHNLKSSMGWALIAIASRKETPNVT